MHLRSFGRGGQGEDFVSNFPLTASTEGSNDSNLMGDYGLGLQSNVRALSPVDFNQLTNNHSLFSPDPKMQDETLAVKQNGETSSDQQQALEDALKLKSHAAQQQQNGDDKVGHGYGQNHQRNGSVDQNVVNSVANSLNQLGLSSAGEPAASTTGGNFWSTATADDTFIQGFQTLNGAVTFQNFPPAPIFNNIGMQQQGHQHGNGLNLQQQQAAQRRAITGQMNSHSQNAHNFPLGQRGQSQNMYSKTYPTWSSAPQGSSWSQNQIPNPWANLQGNRRSVPNLNPIGAPVKKPNSPQSQMNSAMLISPSKFRRSTSFPGQMQHSNMDNKPSMDFPGLGDHRDGGNMLGLQQVKRPLIIQDGFLCSCPYQ